MKRILPSLEYLKECFDLDLNTGLLTWKQRPVHHFKSIGKGMMSWNTKYAGKKAGHIAPDGYLSVGVGNT